MEPSGTPMRHEGGERISAAEYGSDLVVDLLTDLGIRYVVLNPGASTRGIHDSLVNFDPKLLPVPETLLACHEEIATAIAHGYARVTGQPMAVLLHNIVGLQHAAMAIYNAWCDRIPLLVLGGTGPTDTTLRRPMIDWVHTALVQGNQVRDYVKWDDQPASVAAVPESLLRAYRIAMTEPRGPVYICYDAVLQEEAIPNPLTLRDAGRFAPPPAPAANPTLLDRAAGLLTSARWPVILTEDTSRNRAALPALQELAELIQAPVLDHGARFAFPNTHPLDLTLATEAALRNADVLLALDVMDLNGWVSGVSRERTSPRRLLPPNANVIHITMGDLLQHSWSADWGELHPVDVPISADSALALHELVARCRTLLASDSESATRRAQRGLEVERLHREMADGLRRQQEDNWDSRPISLARLYSELWPLIKDQPWSLVGESLTHPARRYWEFTEPEQFACGGTRGGGLGFVAGAAIGAALALKEQSRLCICFIGDGELLYTPSTLWSATHHQVPVLYVVCNNRSYYQDEGHQEFVARERKRPLGNVGVGIHITEPSPDFALLARTFGMDGFGPVDNPAALRSVLEQAVATVRSGRPALVDVITQPR